MSRVSSNLYAICSLDPIVDDVAVTSPLVDSPCNVVVMVCLPLDFDENDGVDYQSRYVSLVIVPIGLSSNQILPLFDNCRAYSAQWVSHMWEV